MRSASLTLLLVLAGCQSGGGSPPPNQQKSSLVRGERESSAQVKSSAARPRPGAEPEEHPLEGDRLALDEARVRAQRAHTESHSEAGLALEDFSHPACGALPRADRRACPLSSVSWSRARAVAGGVEIESTDPKVEPNRLRWQFLCHMAFARSHGGKGCPLGTQGLDLSVLQVQGRTTVRLLVQDASRVDELRRQVRQLINAR